MQNKPNSLDTQMNVTSVKTMNYEQITMNNANKNKPNQTQPEPGSFVPSGTLMIRQLSIINHQLRGLHRM